MTSHLLLAHTNHTPAQGLLGYQPQGLLDFETVAVSNGTGALYQHVCRVDRMPRVCVLAQEASLRSIVDGRLDRAVTTKARQLQQQPTEQLKECQHVDSWREAQYQGEYGSRGPAELVRL